MDHERPRVAGLWSGRSSLGYVTYVAQGEVQLLQPSAVRATAASPGAAVETDTAASLNNDILSQLPPQVSPPCKGNMESPDPSTAASPASDCSELLSLPIHERIRRLLPAHYRRLWHFRCHMRVLRLTRPVNRGTCLVGAGKGCFRTRQGAVKS